MISDQLGILANGTARLHGENVSCHQLCYFDFHDSPFGLGSFAAWVLAAMKTEHGAWCATRLLTVPRHPIPRSVVVRSPWPTTTKCASNAFAAARTSRAGAPRRSASLG
jgi:hypothetical protein